MTQEDKDLLLKDLCGRLMHGVKCKVFDDLATPYTLSGVLPNNVYDELYFEQLDFKESDGYVSVKFCKPYLFPLSSMTEEQKNRLKEIWSADMDKAIDYSISGEDELCDLCQLSATKNVIDWLNANHFDFRGLIDKGLAIDCTNLNIYCL